MIELTPLQLSVLLVSCIRGTKPTDQDQHHARRVTHRMACSTLGKGLMARGGSVTADHSRAKSSSRRESTAYCNHSDATQS